jgi:acetate kinase
MDVLVINCGSSSLKFQLTNPETENVVIDGIVEKIGIEGSFIKYKFDGEKGQVKENFADHKEALTKVFNIFEELKVVNSLEDIKAIGHRVVHGGELYNKSILIDEDVKSNIKNLSELAPLHNPANLIGIETCEELMENAKQVAVFDTAFHQTMPQQAYIYSIPYRYYQKDKVRKYGFHGTSHYYVSKRLAEIENKPVEELNIITCHLGNGASMSAIQGGKSIDTTMGFTPLEGLTMGTRCGDIDPAIITYLMYKENLTAQEVSDILNKESGLLGISGISSDCRDVEDAAAEGNKRAQLALDRLVYVARKNLGSYMSVLNGVDAIIFTAGLGENGIELREEICKNLEHLGVKFDTEANKCRGKEQLISTKDSKVKVYVIPTNEELVIAQDTFKLTK